jgi:type IV secretion system protein TrbG
MNHRALGPFLFVLLAALAAAPPSLASPQAPAATPHPEDLDLSALDRLLAEIAHGPPAPPAPADPEPEPHLPAAADSWPAAPDAAALSAALAEYADTGEPPILGLPTSRVFPHGHEVPVVRCLPLRACDLVFQTGERLAGWALGDSERWLVEQLTEGTGETARPHLLLKPTDYQLATNLVVLTDRRSYRLELESPTHDEVHDDTVDGPLAAYDARISWWYPDDFVHRIRSGDAAAAAAAERAEAHHRGAVALDRPLDPADLSFAYAVKHPWRRSRRLPWKPLTVFDDGDQVFIRLPAAARRSDLPVVLGLLDDGSHYPLAARLDGDWLIVPTLFDRAELVLGTGDHRRRLTLVAEQEGR